MRHYTNPMDSLSQCRVSLQDAYQEIVDCKAKLADAEAERSEARSLLLNGIQTNGDSLAFLEHVRREHAAVVAERDALKAKLAKHAESERAWCELATERGAKLAALESSLAEMAVKLDEGIECYPSSPCNIFATLLELHGLWRGKPSAKVQP